jgi:hypothetical protein
VPVIAAHFSGPAVRAQPGFRVISCGRLRIRRDQPILVLVVSRGVHRNSAIPARGESGDTWAGVSDRITIGGYLLWQAVLAVALMR